MEQLLSSEDAIALIRNCKIEGRRVLGVDGFVMVPDGFEAKLDLILDVSDESKTVEQAAQETEEFIKKHGREGVVFEVCVD